VKWAAILVIVVAAVAAAVAGTMLVRDNQREAERVSRIVESSRGAEEGPATSTDPEVAAAQELACVDRVLGGAATDKAEVDELLAGCRARTERAMEAANKSAAAARKPQGRTEAR
jgi:hypothetical protein